MKRSKKIEISVNNKTNEEIESLSDEYFQKANINPYGNKSDLFANYIINGLKESIKTLEGVSTHTFLHDSNLQEKLSIVNHIVEEKITLPAPLDIYFNDFFRNSDIFGIDMRTHCKWFLKFLQEKDVVLLDIRHNSHFMKKILVTNKKSWWYRQLRRFSFSYTYNANYSASTQNAFERKVFSKIYNLNPIFNVKADPVEKYVIELLEYETGSRDNKSLEPANIHVFKEIMQLRENFEYSKADELVQKLQKGDL